jgi:glycosyltransferase involved in cell wall biosynthesis
VALQFKFNGLQFKLHVGESCNLMKILHVIGSMNPHTGGPCQTIRNFAPWFIEQGNTLEVVCLDNPNSDYLAGETFCIHALGQGRGSWNYHPALLPWLEKNLSRFDVVILNGLWQFQGYALWKAAKNSQSPPYYIFPHGMLDPWFQKMSVRPLKTLRNWIFWKTIQHRVVHQAAGLLFTSEEERRLARLPFRPYSPKQEAVVGLGLPEPPEYHAKMKAAFAEKCPNIGEKKYFLFLGRIHPKKGVDLLIKAYSALSRSTGNSSLPNLVIAGPGLETQFGQNMRKLASEICPSNSIFWPGMLTGDAKWGALYNCEAFVLPSHQENFGIAVVETLSCGRPVLISNQVNIWREIKGNDAALVQKNTVAGTTQLFLDWMNLSTTARSNMAAQAKPCFQGHFSIESTTRRLLAALTSETKCQ